MNIKYHAIANTKEFGLARGAQYIIENTGHGSVYVYDLNGIYLMRCRKDSFDNWKEIA